MAVVRGAWSQQGLVAGVGRVDKPQEVRQPVEDAKAEHGDLFPRAANLGNGIYCTTGSLVDLRLQFGRIEAAE